MKSQRVRIQNFLIALARDSTDFFPVTYKPGSDANKWEADEPDFGTPELVCSALCNEQSSAFDTDAKHGRKFQVDRTSWTFELKIAFSKEVTVEKFEEKVTETPPSLARDEAEGLRGVKLLLERTEITHPVKQESKTGTKAKFFFRADQNRR